MFVYPEDYLKLLSNLRHYLNFDLRYYETKIDKVLKKEFPVAACDDVKLNFNHYSSFEEANENWTKRKERINLENLFVMFFTFL